MFRLASRASLVRSTMARYQSRKTGSDPRCMSPFRRLLSTDLLSDNGGAFPISRSGLRAQGIEPGFGPHKDIRARLMTELKGAMKTKDTLKSTTIRSVLSEVYAADKTASTTASPSVVATILRKAAARRIDSASEFEKAARPDLAEKERQEAAILEGFLPPLLPEADVDRVLSEVIASPPVAGAIATGPPQKALGHVFKAFYAQVDKSSVDPYLVKLRALALLALPR